ncbi:MAG: hypothetical protein K6F09_06875 [Clostridiales bacterium]|nr:hypothetical protein [Clostridiales bacterium]
MKRITALLISVIILCSLFSGCRGEEAAEALTVDGAEISAEVFAYYLGIIMHSPGDHGLTKYSKENEVTEKAVKLCVNYVAVNTLFKEQSFRLTPKYKYEVSENVSSKWSFYSKLYNAVGVSKQTLTKVLANDAKKTMLFLYNYDTGGKYEIPQQDVEKYFKENYVTFKSINGYLTKTNSEGEIVPLDTLEKKSIESKFKAMQDDLLTGTSFEDVAADYAKSQGLSSFSVDLITINKNDNNYPAEFFSSVSSLTPDSPSVIENSEYIFLVEKVTKEDEEILKTYRIDCLKKLCSDEFEQLLDKTTSSYKVSVNRSVIHEIYKAVAEEF